MIKLSAPGATALSMLFWTGKGINVNFHVATLGSGISGGYMIEIDEPNENWPTLKPIVAAFAGTLAGNKVRVGFDGFDPSMTGGRLPAREFWVHSDGTQTGE